MRRFSADPRAPPPPTPAVPSGLPTTGSAPVERYVDTAGLALPPDAAPFLDAWKRPEELVQGAPSMPVVLLRLAAAAAAGDGGGGGGSGGATAEKKGECWMLRV
jgi:hypothetical protein